MSGAPSWTAEQVATARRLLASKATNEECLAVLGRSRRACYVRIARDGYAKIVIEDRRFPPPPSLIEEAEKRAKAPRTITGWLFGDPPPGYSALDRREQRA